MWPGLICSHWKIVQIHHLEIKHGLLENPPVWIHLVRAFPRVSHDFPILSSCFRDFPAVLHTEGPRAPPCCRPVGALRPRLGHIERWPMCPSPARGHCVTGTEQMNVARATELGGFVDF